MAKGRQRDRNRALAARRAQRNSERLQRLEKQLQAHGGAPWPLRGIPAQVWVMCRAVLADPTGNAFRVYAKRMQNPTAIGAIRLAALVPLASVGEKISLYSWADERSRHIGALGLGLLALSAPTRRKGPWSGVVRGITRGALCALLANPYEPDVRPSLTALAGVHRPGADFTTGQVGYLRALEQAGFCYAQQLPAQSVEPFERCFPSGYTSNRYWIVTALPTSPQSDEEKHRLLALHRAGWRALDERPVRVERMTVHGFSRGFPVYSQNHAPPLPLPS